MLTKPELALRTDRTVKAQLNDYCGDPEMWFDSTFFKDKGIYATSFDFFVNWEDNRICDEVWIKRISDSDDIQRQTGRELLDAISDCDGKDKSNRLYRLLAYHRITEKYMLFRDVPESNWEDGSEKVVELDMSKYKDNPVSYYDADEIQTKISELRKTPASIGSAGLIYATSSLEGYLSTQQFFWPGDVDTLLYDGNNNVLAIIEFKKHTANSKIPFSDQRLSNYLEKDILKYRSLALLRDRFNTKLFVLYYPIPRDIQNMIIEKIDGDINHLHASSRFEIDLPEMGNRTSMQNFTESFINEVLP